MEVSSLVVKAWRTGGDRAYRDVCDRRPIEEWVRQNFLDKRLEMW